MNIEGEKIWVNGRQIQGSMLSPDLFSVYINDMIGILSKATLTPIVYADDLTVICDGEHRLYEANDLIDTWTGQNDIEVNKKKSGILVIQNDNNKEKEYRGYQVKNWYKYLGIRMNKELNPMVHLEETRKRLNVYIKRN